MEKDFQYRQGVKNSRFPKPSRAIIVWKIGEGWSVRVRVCVHTHTHVEFLSARVKLIRSLPLGRRTGRLGGRSWKKTSRCPLLNLLNFDLCDILPIQRIVKPRLFTPDCGNFPFLSFVLLLYHLIWTPWLICSFHTVIPKVVAVAPAVFSRWQILPSPFSWKHFHSL